MWDWNNSASFLSMLHMADPMANHLESHWILLFGPLYWVRHSKFPNIRNWIVGVCLHFICNIRSQQMANFRFCFLKNKNKIEKKSFCWRLPFLIKTYINRFRNCLEITNRVYICKHNLSRYLYIHIYMT